MAQEENNQKEDQVKEQAAESSVNEEQSAEAEQEAPSLEQQLEQAKSELEKAKKEYLFLMADFDNFRKRTIKEKADILKNAAEKTLSGILPIVDDFERGISAISEATEADSAKEGMILIYNKLIKYLNENNVIAIESTGTDFDTELHEAIAITPAPTPELKGKVVDTTIKGYKINDKVLRHAKVVVGE